MPIIRSSRLYECYYRLWCAVFGCWLLGVRCRTAGYASRKNEYIIFRPSRRGRPNPIPTLILIFWTPRVLYSHPTRIWYNLPHCLSRKRKEGSIWKSRNDLCHTSNWITRIRSMSTSHIVSGNRCWHTSILYVSNNNYCRTNSVALVREWTIPTERPPPVGEVSANFCW